MKIIKRIIWLILLSWCFYPLVFSQNYTTILTGEIHLFEPEEELTIRALPPARYVRGIKTDSISHEGNDTLIFFQPELLCSDNLDPFNSECLIGPSWLGKGIVKKDNGDEIFLNYQGDSILIKTRAGINKEWVLWQGEDNSFIKAEVTNISKKSFLSVEDSVKVISLKFYDSTGTLVNNYSTGITLELSKNYGLLRLFNFRDFPFNPRNENISPHILAGCSKNDIGLRILNRGDVYDYEVGDEFHTEEDRYIGFAGLRNAIKIILEKTYSSNRDSIKYTIKEKWRYNYPSQGIDIDTFNLEVNGLDKPLEFLPVKENEDLLVPFEAIKMNEQEYSDYIMFSNQNYNGRYQLTYPAEYLFEFEYFTEKFIIELFGIDYFTSIKGCGIYHKKKVVADPELVMDSINLVYFKKGESTWGEPLVLNSVGDYNLRKIVKIYPNPTSKHIFLKWDGANSKDIFIYSIIDVFGAVRNEGELNLSSEGIIDISYLEPGIYFLFFPDFNLTKKIMKL